MAQTRRAPARGHQNFERLGDTRVVIGMVAALALFAGCRRSLAADDAGGNGHIGSDAAADAIVNAGDDGGGAGGADAAADAVADAGGFACGKLLCTDDQVCVTAYLCGGPVNCQDVPDSGVCPPGATFNPSCTGGRPGCIPPCPPPTVFCASRPAACGDTLNCACARAACGGLGDCAFVSDRGVSCANQ